jgi:hypothetical protein
MWMTLTECRTDLDDIGVIGWQSGDDAVPDAVSCDAAISDSPDKDHDRYTRRADLPQGQVALYRRHLSLTQRIRYRQIHRCVWVVSRRHITDGEYHEWIYLTRRRAEQQWARTTATEAGSGCPHSWCGCHPESTN